MNRWLEIGLGLGLLWYGLIRGAKGLVVRVKSFSFRSFDFNNMTVSLNLNLLIKNPLLFGVTIKGVQGNVYMQGYEVGYVNTAYDYHISGGHTHVLPVVVNLNVAQLGQAAMLNIQTGDIRTLTIAFNGKIYVDTPINKAVGIPLQFGLDYNDLMK